MSLVRPILEHGSACWDPCRKGQINAFDQVQKKGAQFTNHMKDSDWETLAQCRTIACLCELHEAYSEEVLGTFSCKPKVFRNRVRKAIINGVKL
jgi:hypothetical protein